jgi:hypothetical protein
MKLTKLQRETVVREIYNDLHSKQKALINDQALLEGEKWFKGYKKTTEYKEYLELWELSLRKGVYISVEKDNPSLYNINKSYNNKLASIEDITLHYGLQAVSDTFKTPIYRSDIETKLILSTIKDFDLETFKQEIAASYGL